MVAAKDGGSYPSVGSPWSFSDSEKSQNICKEHLLICICTFGKANSRKDIKYKKIFFFFISYKC